MPGFLSNAYSTDSRAQTKIDASKSPPVLARFIGKKQSLPERTQADAKVAKRALFRLKRLQASRVDFWERLSLGRMRASGSASPEQLRTSILSC